MDPDGVFSKIDAMLPTKSRQTPRERAQDIESQMNWIRNNGVMPVDEDDNAPISNIGSVPVSRRSPEQRMKDVSQVPTVAS